MNLPARSGIPWGPRLALLALAITAALSVLGAVALMFDNRGPELWLAPTPELMEMVADCDRHTRRAVRERCKQDVVTARLAHDRISGAVAQR
jgi:hypothetical protein